MSKNSNIHNNSTESQYIVFDFLKLNYVEFATTDLLASKGLFHAVFDWKFTDYGPDNSSFYNEGLDRGFYRFETAATALEGAPLLVFYSSDITAKQEKLERHGAVINKPIFEFPGGRRFHFKEPGGNEFAVWSE